MIDYRVTIPFSMTKAISVIADTEFRMMPEYVSVAIDGPVGAGKSTIARAAAAALGYVYVDTGAMYRSVGLYCRRKNTDMGSPVDIAAQLGEISLGIRIIDGVQHIFLNGEDVSE